jgi:UDP-N-acetylmuramoyl-tripeptide--D-alanyl-D-alanine ligase
MAAALALLGQRPVGARGRRVAVLGDMLELGPRGRALHRGLWTRSRPMQSISCSAAGR